MSKTERTKYDFPLVKSVNIYNFSLYEKKGEVELTLSQGVFCLAGANGLGKSTFLNLINFALTGIVLDPNKDFSSIVSTAKFYNLNKKFALDYFDGRVREDDREQSSIALAFTIGDIEYKIERSLFNIDELKSFERKVDGQNTIDDSTTSENFNQYCKNITEDIGLSTFDQFVFLQHFIFSFDEHHTLLFWNREIMETSLYLFFNLDPEDAKFANELRKEIKGEGSLIRNFVYQKNRIVKDAKALKEKISEDNPIELPEGIEEEYVKTNEEIDQNTDHLEKKKSELIQTDYVLTDASYRLSQLKVEYQMSFDGLFGDKDQLLQDQEVITEILNFRNQVCKSENTQNTIARLSELIKAKHCNIAVEESSFEGLQEIDKKIGELNDTIELNTAKRIRLNSEIQEGEKKLLADKEKLLSLDNEYGSVIAQLKELKSKDLGGLLTFYDEQILEKEKEISAKREVKHELELKLKKLERKLNQGYAQAEEEFFPLFCKYAEDFLGLDIDIKLKNLTKGSTLVLIIEDTERNDFYQLSESQRYFIDIALRMAFVQYACNNATILIDTPEGSLDIAYESKAGKMFGDFVQLGYCLVMTANINTSELLLELARMSSSENMTLERMTEWTNLSAVQYAEEEKILRAYNRIEEVLNQTGS